MRNFLKLLVVAMLPATAMADTITVDRARFIGPVEVRMPFATEAKNPKGDTYDIKGLLGMNRQLIYRAAQSDAMIQKGAALLNDTTNKNNALVAMHFTVASKKFAKANLNIKNIKNYKVFVNGKEQSGQLRLTGGTVDVSLLCLTQAANKDSFNVSLTGDKIAHIKVNSEAKRDYNLDEMMYGQFYSGVLISPSGKYQITHSYDKKKGGSTDYQTIVTETGKQRMIYNAYGYKDLKWMPRRDVMYYITNDVAGKKIVTIDPETLEEKVFANNIPDGGFTMAPTEDYLVYSKYEAGKYESGPLKRLHQPDDRMPNWRGRSYVMVYDLKTGVMQQLTFGNSSVYCNDISDDGKKILVSFGRMDTRREPFSTTTVCTINMADNKVDTIFADEPFIASAKFSPDAKQILVNAGPNAFKGIGSELKEGQIGNLFVPRS